MIASAAATARLFPEFWARIGTNPFDFSMTISYAIHATAVPMAIIVRLIVIAITTLCRSADRKDANAYSGINLATSILKLHRSICPMELSSCAPEIRS
jgi:hypothetical protein